MDAHVGGGLQQRGQAAGDVAGEQLAGQVRPRVGHGPETVEDLDVLVADEELLAERAGTVSRTVRPWRRAAARLSAVGVGSMSRSSRVRFCVRYSEGGRWL